MLPRVTVCGFFTHLESRRGRKETYMKKGESKVGGAGGGSGLDDRTANANEPLCSLEGGFPSERSERGISEVC